jgi:hypothetical protein
MSSFNTCIAHHVSAYLAIIRCMKIVGEIYALLYSVVTHVSSSSFYDLNLKFEV